MASHEHHGSQGQMYLKHDWEETSSGHVEHLYDIKLEASPDGEGVYLVKIEEEKHFIRSSDSTSSETRTYISVKDLVLLIERHVSHP